MRVLPADVYDTLELSALAYKGIGGRNAYLFFGDLRPDVPMCVLGHAAFATNESGLWSNPIAAALRSAGINADTNDRAIRRVNRRKGRKTLDTRIRWEEYTRELHIVRGDS